mmetsp:Transcript_60799/g.168571  ORF Transcript_60799/g.168571 Transcript_60799/m.168571 type:complete len:172 (-) Transcript_60799:53-568(-)
MPSRPSFLFLLGLASCLLLAAHGRDTHGPGGDTMSQGDDTGLLQVPITEHSAAMKETIAARPFCGGTNITEAESICANYIPDEQYFCCMKTRGDYNGTWFCNSEKNSDWSPCLCTSKAAPVCASSTEMCFYDPTCDDEDGGGWGGGFGCNAGGVNQLCRFCGGPGQIDCPK